MDEETVPLRGTISTLNWFDGQRKHYETPDQIARRYGLPDDAGMRAFSQGAASLSERGAAEFVRRVPLGAAAAWRLIADPDTVAQWLFDVRWDLRPGGGYRFDPASAGRSAEGEIAQVEAGGSLTLAAANGRRTRFDLLDVSDSARARRDVPNHAGPVAELRIADSLPDGAGVEDQFGEAADEDVALPGGPGTHCVPVLARWHRAASLCQKLAFERAGVHWPPELAVGLNLEALVAAYARLLPARHR